MHRSSAVPSAMLNAQIFRRRAFGHVKCTGSSAVTSAMLNILSRHLRLCALQRGRLSSLPVVASSPSIGARVSDRSSLPTSPAGELMLLSYTTCNLHSWEARRQYVPGEPCKTSSENQSQVLQGEAPRWAGSSIWQIECA
jgi:hypothetical protein